MRTTQQANTATGVIVGRFQLPDLHDAHRQLFDLVMGQHPRVIVAIGLTPIPGKLENPLDFPTIRFMINEHYPQAIVVPINDHRSNETWSQNLDSLISAVAPIGKATLYGGRDSFISMYKGRHDCIELDAMGHVSGTELREVAGRTVPTCAAGRHGVVYGTVNRYPHVSAIADIAAVRNAGGHTQVLFGKKPGDPRWRWPGGFADPSDPHMEACARRELYEETGVSAESVEYVCSSAVPDPRMGERDRIMSMFFIGRVMAGAPPKAADDLSEAKWFPATEIRQMAEQFVPEHQILLEALCDKLNV